MGDESSWWYCFSPIQMFSHKKSLFASSFLLVCCLDFSLWLRGSWWSKLRVNIWPDAREMTADIIYLSYWAYHKLYIPDYFIFKCATLDSRPHCQPASNYFLMLSAKMLNFRCGRLKNRMEFFSGDFFFYVTRLIGGSCKMRPDGCPGQGRSRRILVTSAAVAKKCCGGSVTHAGRIM